MKGKQISNRKDLFKCVLPQRGIEVGFGEPKVLLVKSLKVNQSIYGNSFELCLYINSIIGVF